MFVGVLMDLVKQYLCWVIVGVDLHMINSDVFAVTRDVNKKVNISGSGTTWAVVAVA